IGVFGVAEVLNQMVTHNQDVSQRKPIAQLGQWLPDRKTSRTLVKPTIVGAATGSVIGLVPAVGGDISGIIGWDNARRLSKEKEQFGKGSLKGLMAGDTSTTTTLGGSVTTTMALGIPGDSVMAVLIGSMMIWGIQPGPALFSSNPSMVYSLVAILTVATLLSLAVSLLRMKSMVKLLELNQAYLWIIILVFCMVGTYSINNSVFDVVVMLLMGIIGLVMLRLDFPAGPTVLGLILGPLAEANLRRTLIGGRWESFLSSPIAIILFIISAAALLFPPLREISRRRRAEVGEKGKFSAKVP